jgi:exonuclease III
MATPLKIVLWNANGLAQHAEEVKTYIQLQKVDIMLISETHFTEKSYTTQYTIHTPIVLHTEEPQSLLKIPLNTTFMDTTA